MEVTGNRLRHRRCRLRGRPRQQLPRPRQPTRPRQILPARHAALPKQAQPAAPPPRQLLPLQRLQQLHMLPRQMLVDEGAYFHAIDLSCHIPFLILNHLVTSY